MLYAGEALSSVERNLEPKTYNVERRTVRESRPTKGTRSVGPRPLTLLRAYCSLTGLGALPRSIAVTVSKKRRR
jgi:hypothetical protein